MMSTSSLHINGVEAGPIAFGMMSLTRQWGPMPKDEAVQVMKAALDSGANLWNAGTFYGTPDNNSLHLLKHYFRKYPEDASRVILNLKGAYELPLTAHGSPSGLRKAIDDALAVLDGTKTIDIFEMARVDPNVEIEVSIETLGELVKEGKIGAIGLSEVSAATIRRARKVHKIACVEIELSLFSTDVLHNGVLETCQELAIPVLGYSPLGLGFLTGKIKSPKDFNKNDYRLHMPRFQPDVFDDNLLLVRAVEGIALNKGKTAAQVAIAWVMKQGVIPLPGSNSVERVKENSEVIELKDDEVEEIDRILKRVEVKGGRAPPMLLAMYQ